eukprot:CAMPEP_0194322186 /NCGR_PEP_ID=MMETSP0171-20130528/18340_1 /TAXON_ID=218684 /ORGANISM="Corethron pennatum, Strain L29A3" /LENGTH=372 /DNA_ID=CAMNT_0039080369 /DNA_START=77 /DNA_END=1195 /DNA_ORIENTATION=-
MSRSAENPSAPGENPSAPGAAPPALPAGSRYFNFDPVKLEKLRKEVPWMKDPKYFKKVAVSPSAVMKMMMHCQRGVEKGIAKGGNPIEVMGLMVGSVDPDSPRTLVVTDAFALPIEGFETNVVADDDEVIKYMIDLSESLEQTRREKFMGWYHSHPFDVGPQSHCYLSSTDVTTQLHWQRGGDPHGDPFLAIVVDPLRSLARNAPELKAFRVYPPEYAAPPGECPDGTAPSDTSQRLERWGSCWNRYYTLEIEYFMSPSAAAVLGTLTQNHRWMGTLGRTPGLEEDYRKRWPERVRGAAHAFGGLDAAAAAGPTGPGTGAKGTEGKGGGDDGKDGKKVDEFDKAFRAVQVLASEKIEGSIVQMAKSGLFNDV